MDVNLLTDDQLKEYASMDYYDILEIPKEATSSEIKKAYYKKARMYHPDKNQGDPHAEEMFKLVLEAYTILMDEDKRAFYDKYGKEMMDNQSQGIIDFKQLVKLLFGGNLFFDLVGEMQLYMLDGMMTAHDTPEAEAAAQEAVEAHKDLRVVELTAMLNVRLQPHILGDKALFEDGLEAGLDEKLEHPFGSDILKHVAYVYAEIGKKYMGRFFGVESFFAGIKETVHTVSNGISLIQSGVSLMRVQQEMQMHQEQGTQMDENSQKRFFDAAMYTLWKIGKFEIEEILRRVCLAVVLNEDPAIQKQTAKALFAAGEYYKARLRRLTKEAFSDKIHDFQSNLGQSFANTSDED